jgi:hypothetical protein
MTGDLEATLLRGAIRNANLLAALADDAEIRGSVIELMETLDAIQKEDIRGFRLAMTLNPTTPGFPSNTQLKRGVHGVLEDQLFELFLNMADQLGHLVNEVLFFQEISHNGVCYGSHPSSHFRNSAIMFQPQPPPQQGAQDMKAGVIEAIFEHSSGSAFGSQGSEGYFLVVREHAPINRVDFEDPYRIFGFAAGFLCEKIPVGTQVIKLSQVVSHFVLTTLDEIEAIHVLPVDRVRAVPSILTLRPLCSITVDDSLRNPHL